MVTMTADSSPCHCNEIDCRWSYEAFDDLCACLCPPCRAYRAQKMGRDYARISPVPTEPTTSTTFTVDTGDSPVEATK